MANPSYVISFKCRLDNTNLVILLTAEVELHHSRIYYVVKNFRTANPSTRPVLPNIEIRKVNGIWVHRDSEKETDLSIAAGNAIDQHERTDRYKDALEGEGADTKGKT
jgi:hypothetical protein